MITTPDCDAPQPNLSDTLETTPPSSHGCIIFLITYWGRSNSLTYLPSRLLLCAEELLVTLSSNAVNRVLYSIRGVLRRLHRTDRTAVNRIIHLIPRRGANSRAHSGVYSRQLGSQKVDDKMRNPWTGKNTLYIARKELTSAEKRYKFSWQCLEFRLESYRD